MWSKNKDIRLSVPAGCALANLDIDKNKHIKYHRNVYLLHPLHRSDITSKIDVIFLHGLLGGVFVTWRQRDIKDDTHKYEGLSLVWIINLKENVLCQVYIICVIFFFFLCNKYRSCQYEI